MRSRKGRRKPDLLTSAVSGIARRELGLSTEEAARKLGRSREILGNFELAIYPMSDENTCCRR